MQKRKIYIFAVLLIVLTTFAYSALSTSLSITSEAKLRPISDIRVTKIELDGATNGGLESYSPQFTKDTITNGFVLPNLDSTISYNVTIANNGTIDQAIYDLQTVSSNNNDMIITVDDVPINEALPMIVPFGTYKTIKITYKTNSPSDSVINMVNRFIFKQVYYIDYETKGGSAVATQTKYEYGDVVLEGDPTKNLYVFMGWTDEQNGTTVKYRPGSTYTLNENKTMYAIWRQGEAEFLRGDLFNKAIKQLANPGSTIASETTVDENITSIQRYTGTPSQSILNNAVIVSTDTSDIPIYAWFDNGTIYYYTAAANPYTHLLSHNMFRALKNVTSIDLSTINTSRTRYMHAMFMDCNSLPSLDLSHFNTSSLGLSTPDSAMSHMFNGCSSLTSLNLSTFNTSRITSMYALFQFCTSLSTITFGNNFDTSNVENMAGMFYACSSITSLNLSGFNTSNVTTMLQMFQNCTSLSTITFGNNFDTSSVSVLDRMFYNCQSLQSLNLSTFDTSSANNIYFMFGYCRNLTSLDISNFDLSSVTELTYMLYGMTSLQQLKTPSVYPTDLSIQLPNTFYDPSNNAYTTLSTGNPTETWIKLPYTVVFNANTGTGTMPNQVIGVGATTTLTTNAFTKTGYKFVGWNTQADGQGTAYLNNASVSNLGTFNQTVNLYAQWVEGEATFLYGATVNYMMKELAGTDTSVQTYRHNQFDYNIRSIERSDTLPDNFTPTSDNTLSEESLSDFPIYGWFDNGTLYYYTEAPILKTHGSTFSMFRSLMNVESIDVSSINTSSTYEMGAMFFNCPKLSSIDVSNFDTHNVAGMTDMFNMYYDNNYLTKLDLSSFNIKANASISNMISHTPALEQLKTPSSIGSGVTISLPTTLYDESGNAYTELTSSTPTETWLRKSYTVTFDPNGGVINNLLTGLSDTVETEDSRAFYSISNGTVTVRSKFDDGYAWPPVRVNLEAGKTYIFNCDTNGTWAQAQTGDSVEALLMLNGGYSYYVPMTSNNNFEFTPDTTGTYWLRLDVNQAGKTHTFSNISIQEKNQSKEVIYNQQYGTLPTPTREGYTFDGWTNQDNISSALIGNSKECLRLSNGINDRSFTYPYNLSEVIEFDITIIGGTITLVDVQDAVVDASNYTIDGNRIYGSIPITQQMWNRYHTSYKFLDITSSERITSYTINKFIVKTESTTTNQIESDHTLYAKWSANQYTVNYNGNGNTGGTTASSTHTYDVASNLTTNGFTKTGYKFVGWNTRQDGTGTPYLDGASVTRVGTGGTVTLYAQWIEGEATFVEGRIFNVAIKKLATPSLDNITTETVNVNITSIEIANSVPSSWVGQDGNIIPPSNDNIVSTVDSDFPIYAWYDNGTIYYYSETTKLYFNSSTYNMFRELRALVNLNITSIDSSRVVVMYQMFSRATSLVTLDLSNFDTSNVTSMYSMFSGSSQYNIRMNIENIIGLDNFDTSNVNDVRGMFSSCYKIKSLDLSSFDLSSLIYDPSTMLNNMTSLEKLKTPSVYPSNLNIDLPKTLYDESGNSYTTLQTGDPTETWLRKVYTVTFDPNGGSVSTSSKSVLYNQQYGELPTPTREGYTFDGWYTDNLISTNISDWEQGGIMDSNGIPTSTRDDRIRTKDYIRVLPDTDYIINVNNSNDIDIRSVYFYNQDKTYNSMTGVGTSLEFTTGSNVNYIKVVLQYGDTHTTITPSDVTTANINLVENVTSSTIVTQDKDHTLTAHWTPNQYTMTFNSNGGVTANPSSVTKSYGDTLGIETENLFTAGDTLPGHKNTSDSMTKELVNDSESPSGTAVKLTRTAVGTKMTAGYYYGLSRLPEGTSCNYSFYAKGSGTWRAGATQGNTQNPSDLVIDLTSEYELYTKTFIPQSINSSAFVFYERTMEDGTYIQYHSIKLTCSMPVTRREGYTFKGWTTDIESEIPSTYKQLDYIESTGTQYIDTGYVPKTTTKLELDLSFNGEFKNYRTYGGNSSFMGVYDNNGYSAYAINYGGSNSENNSLYLWFNKQYPLDGTTAQSIVISDAVRTSRSKLIIENGGVSYDSVSRTLVSKESDNINSMYLFGINKIGINNQYDDTTSYVFTSYNMRVYEMKIYENNVLVRHYVPVLNTSTHRLGLYETVNGLFYGNSGTGEFNAPTVNENTPVPASNKTYYALWEPNTYTVAFNKNDNDATGSMSNQLFDYGVSQNLTTNGFTKTGYTFTGWNTKADGTGTAYLDGASVSNLTATNNGTITLYAQWIINSYTISYDANGGTGTMSNQSVNCNSQVTLNQNTFTKTGYSFTGWNGLIYSNDTEKNSSNDMWPNDNEFLQYDDFAPYFDRYGINNKYHLELDLKSEDTTNRNIITIYFQNGGGTKYYMNSKDITVSSTEWTHVSFDFDIYIDDASSERYAKLAFYGVYNTGNKPIVKNVRLSILPELDDEETVQNLSTEDGAIVKLYANWSPNQYTINYNGNGNTGGTTASSTHTYDVAANLTTNGYTRTGYKFAGWNTQADGQGTAYLDGASVSNLTSTNNGSVTLYAQWREGEATFINGSIFNYMVKELAGTDTTGNQYRHNTNDYNITSIQKSNTLPNNFVATSDNTISIEDSDYPIYAWYDNGTIYYYSEAINLYFKADSKYMFRNMRNLSSIDISSINTSRVTTMLSMFVYCNSLTQLDLSSFDMSNVSSTTSMLGGMPSLEQLKTPNTIPSGITITLPTTLYDESGNAYTELTSSTPTETWLRKSYTVTADPNGGNILSTPGWTGTGSTATKSIIYGQAYGTLPSLYKDGYQLTGWRTKTSREVELVDNHGLSYDTGAYVEDNLYIATPELISVYTNESTLYTSLNCKIYMYDTNSNYLGSDTEYSTTHDLLSGTKYIRIEILKQGNNYDYWNENFYLMEFIDNNTNVYQASNHSIIATWEPNTYTISYKANGGTGTMNDKGMTYGVSDYLTTNTFTRSGYTFVGWNTQADGQGTGYIDEAYVSNLTILNNETVTLYAQWIENPTITFDNNYQANNTYDLYNSTFSYIQGGTYTKEIVFDEEINDYVVKLTINTLSTNNSTWIYVTPVYFTSGVENTYQFFVKSDRQISNAYYVGIEINGYYGAVNYTTSWQRLTKTFTAPSDISARAFYVVATADLQVGDSIYLYGLSIEEGDNSSNTTTLTRNYNSPITTLPTSPTREGYTFDGWYTEPVGGTQVSASTVVTTDETYYAHWTSTDPETRIRSMNTLGSSIADDDPDSNLRFIGSDPNNYVSCNNLTWRIIGVCDGKLKLVQDPIGHYSYDTSKEDVNKGYGVNAWEDSDLMKLLNPGYENNTDLKCKTNTSISSGICNCGDNSASAYEDTNPLVNNSLYWTGGSGLCYTYGNYQASSCSFTNSGLQDNTTRNMIDNATWYLGSNDASADLWGSGEIMTASYMYNFERGNLTGKQCSSGWYCSDQITRNNPPTWTGKVGLIYPSDYAYATSGGNTTDRATCLSKQVGNVDANTTPNWYNTYTDCKDNNWLLNASHWSWLLSPNAHSLYSPRVFRMTASGYITYYNSLDAGSVRPTVYLKSGVKMTGGTGSNADPFVLSYDE